MTYTIATDAVTQSISAKSADEAVRTFCRDGEARTVTEFLARLGRCDGYGVIADAHGIIGMVRDGRVSIFGE